MTKIASYARRAGLRRRVDDRPDDTRARAFRRPLSALPQGRERFAGNQVANNGDPAGSSGPSPRPPRHSALRKPRTSGSSSSSRGTSGLCNATASHALKPRLRQRRQKASIWSAGPWSRAAAPPFPAASRSAARNPSAARPLEPAEIGPRSATAPPAATSRASVGQRGAEAVELACLRRQAQGVRARGRERPRHGRQAAPSYGRTPSAAVIVRGSPACRLPRPRPRPCPAGPRPSLRGGDRQSRGCRRRRRAPFRPRRHRRRRSVSGQPASIERNGPPVRGGRGGSRGNCQVAGSRTVNPVRRAVFAVAHGRSSRWSDREQKSPPFDGINFWADLAVRALAGPCTAFRPSVCRIAPAAPVRSAWCVTTTIGGQTVVCAFPPGKGPKTCCIKSTLEANYPARHTGVRCDRDPTA